MIAESWSNTSCKPCIGVRRSQNKALTYPQNQPSVCLDAFFYFFQSTCCKRLLYLNCFLSITREACILTRLQYLCVEQAMPVCLIWPRREISQLGLVCNWYCTLWLITTCEIKGDVWPLYCRVGEFFSRCDDWISLYSEYVMYQGQITLSPES